MISLLLLLALSTNASAMTWQHFRRSDAIEDRRAKAAYNLMRYGREAPWHECSCPVNYVCTCPPK